MGRGLSDLQKTILVMAREKRSAGRTGGQGKGAQLYYAEILAAVWGWEPTRCELNYPRDIKSYYGTIPEGAYHHGKHFDKQQIGEREYNAALASLSRAVRRLDKRGLLETWYGSDWAGVCLTDAGTELAESLSVNSNDNVKRINRYKGTAPAPSMKRPQR